MNIGYLIPEYPGQTHSFFWREIEALQQRHGHRVKVFSTRLPAEPVYHDWTDQAPADYLYPIGFLKLVSLVPALASAFPKLISDRDTRRILRNPRNLALFVMAMQLGRFCHRHEIEHLHIHSCANAALIGALLNQVSGLPYSLVLHGPIHYFGPYQFYKWRRAAFAIAITKRLQSEVAELFPERTGDILVAPMGVDVDQFHPKGRDSVGVSDVWRWFSCGRLNRGKGYDVLLKAIRILVQDSDLPPFRVDIAGEDEQGGKGYRATLAEEIKTAELNDIVCLRGAIEQKQVQKSLQRADGFVLASREEALGVAYMEAMACGLPTIGTNTGGVAELINDGKDGLLVSPGDEVALAHAMRRVMLDGNLRIALSKSARHRVVTQFDSARSADVLASALERVGISKKSILR